MARMSVVTGQLEASREAYCDFVITRRSEVELFSARLVEGSDTLQVTWTASLGLGTLVNRLRQVQELAGGPGSFVRITGLASDALLLLIQSGRFPARRAAQMLGEKLGGTWRVHVRHRPNSESWKITALRLGG